VCVALNHILFIDYQLPSLCYIEKVAFSAEIEGLFNKFNENNTANLRPSSNDDRSASE
jgi:hypothetical protein